MAVLWMDGFDHYGTTTADTSTVPLMTAAGYLFGSTWRSTGMLLKAAPSSGNLLELVSNRGFGPNAGGSQKITVPTDASTTAFLGMQIAIITSSSAGTGNLAQCFLFSIRGFMVSYSPPTGRIFVSNRTTTGVDDEPTGGYTDTGFFWPAGARYFVDVVVNTSSFDLYIDNKLVGSYPMTVNTNPITLSPGYTTFGSGSSVTFQVDHLYTMSATGDDPKLRIGAQVINTRVPTTLVSNDLWTASVGSDFVGLVAKLVPNDGTYITSPDSPNDGKQILYSTSGTPFTASGNIRAVAYTVRAAKSDSGVRNLTIVGGGKTLQTSGLATSVLVKQLVIGGAAGSWTSSRLQSDNFGVQVDA